MPVRLRGLEQTVALELLDDPRVRLFLRQTCELAGFIAHASVEPDHGQLRQPVVAADLPVHGVVARRDLHRAGPELRIDTIVFDDREPAPDDREDGFLSHELAVPLVAGMDRDRDVREHRRRPHGRDRDVP